MAWIVQLIMNYRILLLVCLLCIAAVPLMTASGDYMGGGIQLGGSGTKVTIVTTEATTEPATAALPLATLQTVGALTVTTSPAGATIYIDGAQRGISPATIPRLFPGSHTLLLKLDGYQDLSAPVTITAGQTETVTFALSPLTAAGTAIPAGSKKKAPGFEALLGIAALGAVVLVTKTRR
ncbi:MAG: PEGA domain-containing protein [Methanoregula sp.]